MTDAAAAAAPAPAPAPEMRWEDVTDAFRTAVKELGPWRAVHDPRLSMELLIAAPEVLDPKTDCALGWRDVKQLKALQAAGTLPPAAKLSAAEVADVMDALMLLEARWMEFGEIVATLGRCAFLYDITLVEGHASLRAFVRALLKTVGLQYTLLTTAQVNEEEEFSNYPAPEINTFVDAPPSEFFAELDAAIAAEASAEVKTRLQLRRETLAVLDGFFSCSREGTAAGRKAAAAALELVSGLKRTAPLALHPGVFHPDVVKWWTSGMPVAAATPPTFEEGVATWRTHFANYIAVFDMSEKDVPLLQIPMLLESFAARCPSVLHRSAAMMIAINPTNNEVLQRAGQALPEAILDTIGVEFGGPIYRQIMGGNRALLGDAQRYFQAHGNRAMPFELVESIAAVVDELTQLVGMLFAAALRNRGRYHRTLGNIIKRLHGTQRMAMVIDHGYLCAAVPLGGADKFGERDVQRAAQGCLVLSSFLQELASLAAQRYIELTMELDLLTRAELTAAIYYRNAISTARLNTYAQVRISAGDIPPPRANAKTGLPLYAPALYSRQVPRGDLTRRDGLAELTRVFLGGVLAALGAFTAAGLVDLSSPPESVLSLADTFDYRFVALQAYKPHLPFDQISASFAQLLVEGTPDTHLATAARNFATVAVRAKELLEEAPGSVDADRLAALAKVAKANSIAATLVKSKLADAKAAFEFIKVEYTGAFALPQIQLKLKL